MDLADIRERIISEVKDESGKLEDPRDIDNGIETALKEYSGHSPDTLVEDVAGNGTHDLDLPAGWVDEFSSIKSIEYPIGDVPATHLDDDEYAIYEDPAGDKLRLVNNSPEATESVRVKFSIFRTAATVPDKDIEAFILLGASYCLDKLANAFIQSSDSLISADSVDRQSKSREAGIRAKSLRKRYREQMGLKEGDITPPASATVDLDYKYPGGGRRLTHPRSSRENR